jgi:hypothetical protein
VHTVTAAKMRNTYCSTKIFSLPGNCTVALTNFLPSQHETIKAALAAICVPSSITLFRAEVLREDERTTVTLYEGHWNAQRITENV